VQARSCHQPCLKSHVALWHRRPLHRFHERLGILDRRHRQDAVPEVHDVAAAEAFAGSGEPIIPSPSAGEGFFYGVSGVARPVGEARPCPGPPLPWAQKFLRLQEIFPA